MLCGVNVCAVFAGSGEESAQVIAQLCNRVYPTIEDSTSQGTSSDPLPEEIPLRADEGLLGDTMRVVDQSLHSRLDAMVGPTDDMGFQYFTEKVQHPLCLCYTLVPYHGTVPCGMIACPCTVSLHGSQVKGQIVLKFQYW